MSHVLMNGDTMLKNVTINNLFDKEDVNIDFSKRSVIITGDNGNGKTTILNIIYNVLVGNYYALYKINFEKAFINFQSDFKYMNEIKIERENNNNFKKMTITYRSKKDSLKIKINASGINSIISVESIERNQEILYNEKYNENLLYNDDSQTILELLESIHENKFNTKIREINKSLLYFPTYRRIDLDIESYFTNLYEPSMISFFTRDRSLTKKKFGTIDRRVIGISNTDIEDILREYTRTINEISSQSLDNLLKNFAKNSILGINNEKLEIQFSNFSKRSNILDQLKNINDSLDLRISDEQLTNIAKQFEEKLLFMKKIGENKPKSKEEMNEVMNLILSLPMMQVFQNLQELYKKFSQEMNSELESFANIQENLLDFSGNRLNLNRTELNEFNFSKVGTGVEKFNDFSTGEKQLITFLVYSAIELPKDTPSLIIIDEPELSLHVKWQRKLLKNLLKKNNIKILSATHSPYILNKLEVDSMIVRKQEANEC